jgi:hypothetical protein
MKFALWFVCIVFPLMYIFMGDFALGAVCTMFLFGVVTGIRWLFAKAQEAKMKRNIESRVTKLT